MNKLIFHEGGQPIVLDDIKLLQDNPLEQFKALLEVLSGGLTAYLMYPMKAEIVSAEPGKTVVRTNRNLFVENGIVYPLGESTFTVSSWDTPLYVGIRKSTADVRIFEDGQENACIEAWEAYLTLANTIGVYEVSTLKTLFEAMAPLVASKVPAVEYKDIKVIFFNGYTGQVQYKEERDFYRVRVKLRSDNHSWNQSTGLVFELDDGTPRWLNGTASLTFMTGGDSSSRAQESRIIIRGEMAHITGSVNLDSDPPSNCPIITFIDIPK